MLTTAAKPGETQAEQMARSVASVEAEVGQAWKNANAVNPDTGGTLDATLTAGSLGDWIAVRNRLRTVPTVRGAELLSFDRSQIRVAIRYIGDRNQLRTALGEHGLELAGADPDWTLALHVEPAAAEPAPAKAAPAPEPVANQPAAEKPARDDGDESDLDSLRKPDE